MDILTPDWVQDAVFYQIFPDRFAQSDRVAKPTNLQAWGAPPTYHAFQGGDLLGVVEKLDYIASLGVNALYLNPIFASAANHRYHTYDYFQVDPILGGNAALAELIAAAHKRNIRVILDGVFNHSSRGFFQFNHLMEAGEESPYTDWFTVKAWPINAFNLHEKPNYEAWWDMPALPEFNTDTTAVREFLWSVATYWLEQGIDGWRLDVPGEIDDDEFWREFRRRCRAVNPDAYIVGELWDEAQRWLQGDQFDAQMNYLFTRAAFGFFTGDNLDRSQIATTGYGNIQTITSHQFAAELDRIFNKLYHPKIVLAQMNMLGSHDTPRLISLNQEDVTAANTTKLMFMCQMSVPGAPNIYYGDEIGLPGLHDPDNRRAFPWDTPESWNNSLLEWLKPLVQLRHETAALRRGDFKVLLVTDQLVVYQRQYEGQTAVIAFNAGTKAATFIWPADGPVAKEKLVSFTSGAKPGQIITMKGRSGRIWVS